ncbi:unnamed protein product [Diabrotica balteata]|uniref:Uncharacterized protein n=1 Tax=Diabrotica balteata TaxID=107213 RepID=A0A9N9XD43_DIABA|nr:unnamed protein product [Diabrotica balteata]
MNTLDKSDIYKLKCDDCVASFVGRSIRKVSTRISEHLKRPNSSSFGQHLLSSKYNFNINSGSSILHDISRKKNYIELDLLEDLDITRETNRNSHCFNTQINLNCTKFKPIFKNFITASPPSDLDDARKILDCAQKALTIGVPELDLPSYNPLNYDKDIRYYNDMVEENEFDREKADHDENEQELFESSDDEDEDIILDDLFTEEIYLDRNSTKKEKSLRGKITKLSDTKQQILGLYFLGHNTQVYGIPDWQVKEIKQISQDSDAFAVFNFS